MRRALLVGSQTGGLAGVEADVDRMGDALSRQGFSLTVCTGSKASRKGILAAYEQLIDDARSDDAACVYYSGHGNLAPNPYYQPGKQMPQALQYIIPTDDGPDDFQGIMSFELSGLLARLTEKTRNVTVILDCCHSARMSRAARERGLVPKSATSRVSDQALAQRLRDSYPVEALLDPESNPHAVRLVAAEAQSLAFERVDERGQSTGAFTEALLQAFTEVGSEPVSWNAIALRVRELVMGRIPDQRPDAEGPRRRRLWAVEEVRDERPLALFFKGDTPLLRGGALLGVVPGATYGLMAPNAERWAAERALGSAVVEENLGSVSRVSLQAARPGDLPRTGLLAFPLSTPARRCQVAVAPDVPAALRARLADSRLLAPIDGQGGALVPSLVLEGELLVVRDGVGELLVRAPAGSPDAVVDRLERLARAEALRNLEPGGLEVFLDVSFGRVENGARVPMQAGETVHVGDRQYLEVLNDGFEPVFVAVFGIDAAHDVFLMSRRAPRGQRLMPRERLVLGETALGGVPGVAVSWPASLPPDRPRLESLVVIAADDEQDYQLLTTSGRSRGGLGSSLERRLDQIRGGSARSRGAEPAGGAEYALRRIDYQLAPTPRAAGT